MQQEIFVNCKISCILELIILGPTLVLVLGFIFNFKMCKAEHTAAKREHASIQLWFN